MGQASSALMEGSALDMTPMIDVVFQLIIFFMIAIDMSQQDLEDLQMPKSVQAADDKDPEEGRLYVNVNRKGDYIIKRQPMTIDELEANLRARVFLPRPKGLPVKDKDGLAERPILIRADRATEFKHVQKVMYKCALEGLKVWKLELGVSQDEQAKAALDAAAGGQAK